MRDFETEYADLRRRMAFQESMTDFECNDPKLLSLLVYVGNNKFPSSQVNKMNNILNFRMTTNNFINTFFSNITNRLIH